MPEDNRTASVPRIPLFLLHLRFSGEYGESLVGDVVEEYRDVATGPGGVRQARIWLWRQVLASLVARVPRASGPDKPGEEPAGVTDRLRRELGLSVRRLARRPVMSAVVILTIGLGIGANSLILSVVSKVLMSPLPHPGSDRLVGVFRLSPQVTGDNPSTDRLAGLYAVPYALFLDWQEGGASFSDIGAYAGGRLTMTGSGEPERIQAVVATSGVFSALCAVPALGRPLVAEDDRVGAAAVAVLSHGLWSRSFGSDPQVVGRQVTLDGSAYTVVGVMPAGFYFPDGGEQLWVNFWDSLKTSTYRAGGYLQVLARLRPGVTLRTAQAEMDRLAVQLGRSHPEEREHGVRVVLRKELVVVRARAALGVFTGAAAMVLLIACANIAGLLLVRTIERRRELAVRTALGAGRKHIVLEVLSESVLLALGGGVLGAAVAVLGLKPFVAAIPGGLARGSEIGVSYGPVLVAGGLALLSGLAIGVLPAFRAARRDCQAILSGGGRGAVGGPPGGHSQTALVAIQIALAFVLLAGAGLFVKSYQRLSGIDPGFATADRLVAYIGLPDRYSEADSQRRFFEDLQGELETLPGVIGVATVEQIPFLAGLSAPPTWVEIEAGFEEHAIHRSVVSPTYLAVMDIPVLTGRGLTRADNQDAAPVALVNEAMAREFWPDGQAIGRRIRTPGQGEQITLTVVGVVGDIRYGFDPRSASFPEYYVSALQFPGPNRSVVVRTAVEPRSLAASVRSKIGNLEPALPVQVGALDELIRSSPGLTGPRFGAMTVGVLAVIATFLAVIGIFAALAFVVAQRTPELGVRLALGASQQEVVRSVLGRGLSLAGMGLALGLLIALAGSRALRSILFNISPQDPVTLIQVALLVLGAVCAAALIPAWRASRVDPVRVLRQE